MSKVSVHDKTLGVRHEAHIPGATPEAALDYCFDICRLSWEPRERTGHVIMVRALESTPRRVCLRVDAIYEGTEQVYTVLLDHTAARS